MNKQQTLLKEISYTGNGLHSGKEVTMTLKPAEENTGIIFVRTDLENKPRIHAKAEMVTSTLRATTISENEVSVFTIEHLMGALCMMGIDNCIVEMSSGEPPVMDGSGLEFSRLILKAGRKEQDAERDIYVVKEPVTVYDGGKYIMALPYDGYRISFTSLNDYPLIGDQYYDVELTEESFLQEIAAARTIGFMDQVEQMQKMGLGLGGTLENAVIYDDEKCLSELRFKDELVRHKILDVIGDLYLLGRMKAHIIAVGTGHAYNSQLAKKILKYRECK